MRLRRALEQAARDVAGSLGEMAAPLEGRAQILGVAAAVCDDPQLAKYLSEIFERIGEYGPLEVRSSPGRELKRQYVDGIYWRGGVFSRLWLDKTTQRVELPGAGILISDLALESPRALVPLLELAARARIHTLAVVASKMSDGVLALMSANQNPRLLQVIGVKAPEATPMGQAAALEDIAVLTGGRAIPQAAGNGLIGVRLEDLGRAESVWADGFYFGVSGGGGSEADMGRHLARLEARHAEAEEAARRKELQQRIGTMRGRTAILWTGGGTKAESETRKNTAERAAESLRAALREGVVPGGGAALLACRHRLLARRAQRKDAEGQVARRIVGQALEEPLRQIAANAGYSPGEVMAELRAARPGCGFDVRAGRATDMLGTGVLDSAAVVKAAAYTAIVSAALLLTVDVLVHHRKPVEAMQP
jgi:chaperonin GroEL